MWMFGIYSTASCVFCNAVAAHGTDDDLSRGIIEDGYIDFVQRRRYSSSHLVDEGILKRNIDSFGHKRSINKK